MNICCFKIKSLEYIQQEKEIQLMRGAYSHTTKVIGNNEINFPSFVCLAHHLDMNYCTKHKNKDI